MSNYGRTKDYYKNVLDEYEKKENKNSLDEANNNSALSAYYQKNFLEETYTKANEDLNKSLENQQRSAYFNNEKILKYLPNSLKVNGLQNNTGVSSQAYLDANNNYQNNLNTINNNYQSNKSTLENTYNENMLKVDDNYNNALVTNKTNYWNDVTNKNNAIINMQTDLLSQAENYGDDYGIGYTEEGVNKLKEYVKTQDLPDDVKSQLETYIDNNFNIATEDEISEVEWGNKLQTNYGVTEDTTVIDNNSAGTFSFGKFNGTGEGKKQDTYVSTILQLAKDGKIANGTVVDFNYGSGKANYVYANGKWYKTNNTADITEKNVNTLSGGRITNISSTKDAGLIGKVGKFITNAIHSTDSTVEIDGKKYAMYELSGTTSRTETANKLNAKYPNRKTGDVYNDNGTIYAYYDGTWYSTSKDMNIF